MSFRYILCLLALASNGSSFGQNSNASIISSTPSLKKAYDFYENDKFVACIRHCDSILGLKSNTLEEKYGANELKAGSHYSMGDVQGALKYKLKMLSYEKVIKVSTSELYYAYDHLAKIYQDLNKLDEAIEASRKAFRKVQQANKDTSVIILASNNLGYRLLLEERNSEAIYYFKKGISYYMQFEKKRENDHIIYHILLGNLGYLEAQSGDDAGIKKLETTLQFLDKKNFNKADTRIKLAKIYILKRDFQYAERFLNEAHRIAQEYNQLENLETILFEKTILYAATGEAAKLKQTKSDYAKLQLKLKIENSANQALSELSTLKLNKSESERKSLQNKIKVADQQTKINKLILIICIIIAAAILAIVLVLYRKRKTEILQQKELHEIKGKLLETKLEKETKELENITKWFEIQKREMSQLLVSSRTREEKLVNIIQELKDLKKSNSSDVNTILSDIQIKLNSISAGTEVKEITNLDNLKISAFRNALITAHPHLSANEIDLCKMIVSGMDSKKIGNVKNISPTSVRTNKSRLKKKLGLKPSEDLDVYLVRFSEK